MPQKKKPARIYLRERPGRASVFVIKDYGGFEVSTGTSDITAAQIALDEYLTQRFRPRTATIKKPVTISKSRTTSGVETAYSLSVEKEARRMMRGILERCRTHKRDVNLDIAWLGRRLVNQNLTCAISGMKFSIGPSETGRRSPFSPSPDRIDRTKGYTRDNVRLVAIIVNNARADFSDDEFIAMCRNVANMNSSIGKGLAETLKTSSK